MNKTINIEITNFSDEELIKIIKANYYKVSKVILNINDSIVEELVSNRICELTNNLLQLVNLLHNDNEECRYKEAYNNIWFDLEMDENGNIDAVTDNTDILLDAIKILCSIDNYVCSNIKECTYASIQDYIYEKLDNSHQAKNNYNTEWIFN